MATTVEAQTGRTTHAGARLVAIMCKVLAIAAVLLLTGATTSNAQDAATRRDRQGPVTVTVTLTESSAGVIKAKVILAFRRTVR